MKILLHISTLHNFIKFNNPALITISQLLSVVSKLDKENIYNNFTIVIQNVDCLYYALRVYFIVPRIMSLITGEFGYHSCN